MFTETDKIAFLEEFKDLFGIPDDINGPPKRAIHTVLSDLIGKEHLVAPFVLRRLPLTSPLAILSLVHCFQLPVSPPGHCGMLLSRVSPPQCCVFQLGCQVGFAFPSSFRGGSSCIDVCICLPSPLHC